MVITTKLTPPRRSRQTLHRARLTARLQEATGYRLTIVQAGAGYGKSTALAALLDTGDAVVWYHLEEEDAEPLRFLAHLLHGFTVALPAFSQTPQALLEQWERSGEAGWSSIVSALVNALAETDAVPLYLVLDDVHHLNLSAETRAIVERLIQVAPAHLHIIMATRYPLQLGTLSTLRVRGALLHIGQDELAFTAPEIIELFQSRFDFPLTLSQATLLADKIDGWAIALPLVWQQLQRGDRSLPLALSQLSGSADDLFTFLAHEVLSRQPEHVQRFLRETALLRRLDAAICDCVRDADDSAAILHYLQEYGLFVTAAAGNALRYHHLFRDILSSRLSAETTLAIHFRAAQCYHRQRAVEEAIHHYLAAHATTESAELLAEHGRNLISMGRLDTVANWIASLPPGELVEHPILLIYMGDVARLHSRFDAALGWYKQAESQYRVQRDLIGVGLALRAQARVYLDTVDPAHAERLLQEALRLSDRQEDRESRMRLFELLAENALNRGRMDEANRLRSQAHALKQVGHDESELPVRMLLRTGRLAQARSLLESKLQEERLNPVMRSRAHRETLLVLSLIYSMMGEQEAAQRTAVAGTERGAVLEAPFVTAVGVMRQGHAAALCKDEAGYKQAVQLFEQGIQIADELDVPRLKVEAYWGLCQVYGFRGQLDMALDSAESGIAIAQHAGDDWVIAGIRTSTGASYALAGQYDAALGWLAHAVTSFRDCSDTHGEANALLWQCLVWYATDDETRLKRDLDTLLQLVRDHDYAFLFQRRTLMGPPDPRRLMPLLLFAARHGALAAYAQALLEAMGMDGLEFHPGYQLRVTSLGAFRLYFGVNELPGNVWTRQQARQLLHLFLTYRRSQIHREQIMDTLWPDLPPEDASRNFKITYNTLCKVLEPERKRNAPSAFIVREGSRYGLRPEADIWFDAAEFDAMIRSADRLLHTDEGAAREQYRQALALYQGDYLEEFPYEEWVFQERKRLLNRYLRSAERLARSLIRAGEWDEAIEVCNDLLERDDCWEPAYQMLMTAYARQGNRTQVVRTLQRCRETLRNELAVEPTVTTLELFETLI
ncbi:MAG: transcriptional regulator [Anaerolineae bacterium]|nr:transcriptional regulator [Anaerolineae bacterium]